MSIIYMLSGPGKNTGFPKEIKKVLKSDLNNKKNIAFIPTTPDNFLRNDLYVYGDKNNMKGILEYLNEFTQFENVSIIDYRLSKEEAIKKITESDVLYLLGGNPFTQLEYINSKRYDKLIKKFPRIIIGTSAGAMNIAKKAYCSKDENFDKSIFYNALNIVDVTIDPHFDMNNEIQVDEIVKNSRERKIIGLPDSSGIRIINNKIEYINKCYVFNDGKMEKIN